MHIGNLNAGFQRFDKAAALVIDALEYELNDGFLGLPVVDFPQCRHCVRLCRVQKAKQQFAVHGRGAVIIRFAFALYVAVILNQIVDDITLIVALCSDNFHGATSQFILQNNAEV